MTKKPTFTPSAGIIDAGIAMLRRCEAYAEAIAGAIPAAGIIDAGISMRRSGYEYAAMLAAEIPRLSKATQPQRDKWAFALVQGVIQQVYPGVAVSERSKPQPNAYPWEIVCEDDDKRKAVAKRVSLLLKPLKEGEVSISGMRAAGAGADAAE